MATRKTTEPEAPAYPDRAILARIGVEAQLDPRTVRRAVEKGIDSLQSDFAKTRLRSALRKMQLTDLLIAIERARSPAG